MAAGVQLWIWDTANKQWVKLAGTAAGAMSIHAIVEELDDIEDVNVPVLTDGYVLYWDAAAGKFQLKEHIPANIKILNITFIIDGGGAEITDGQKGHLEIPFACTIDRVTMMADQEGSIIVDIWKDTYALFPPTDGDSITSATPPTIAVGVKSQDSTLAAWTTAIVAGDILAFNVDSCTDIQRVTISLKVTKT